MKTLILAQDIWYLVRNSLIWILSVALLVLLQSSIIVSPSHPFVDNDGDGIDDFEEGIGEYADPEVRARIYGVNFPIAELGNCTSYYECRSFCEDPVNGTTCYEFGKGRGLYKDADVDPNKKDEILGRAKTELGCDSYDTCKSFCEVPANFDKCDSFARSVNVSGGHVYDPRDERVLGKAKEALGCDSFATCATFCSDPANKDKCTVFAKDTGLRGGEVHVGPGGCTSEATCKSFCSDPNNFQVCHGFTQAVGGQFSGPGGCNSEESCKAYCQQNPTSCGGFGRGGASPPPGYNPQEMCNRTPNCSWTGGTCQCGSYKEDSQQRAGEYAKYCSQNPANCTPGGVGGFESKEDRATFERYCTQNPDRCRPAYSASHVGVPPPGEGGVYTYDPAKECTKYAGCAWTGSTCQCSTSYYSYPSPTGGISCPQGQYIGPGGYCIQEGFYSYPTPSNWYSYPSPGGTYSYPSPSGSYSYPTPGSYAYPTPGSYYTPGGYSYPTPGSYSYPSPGSYSYPTPYGTPSYGTPSYSYPSPSYGTPSYGTPSYGTPSYGTPSYGTPSYDTPSYSYPAPYGTPAYATPGIVGGVSKGPSLFDLIWNFLSGK